MSVYVCEPGCERVCTQVYISPHLVEHAVQESGHDGEHGGFESLQIVHQHSDVSLKETDLGSVHQNHALEHKPRVRHVNMKVCVETKRHSSA